MPDNLRSPIKHHLVPHRIKSEQRIQSFHSLMIERALFGASRLVRQHGRIGTKGQEAVEGSQPRPRRAMPLRRRPASGANGCQNI